MTTATTTALTLALNNAALDAHAGNWYPLKADLVAALVSADRTATAHVVGAARTVDEFRTTARVLAAALADEAGR